ncbi:MAG: hydrogenase nickel incorporation protein HypB [Nocardioidaceae bacterium]
MCDTCGCSDDSPARVTLPGRSQPHSHPHTHAHSHPHPPAGRTIVIEQDLLAKNDELAAYNRGWLAERDMTALNLMSSPGAGKTSLLERTIREASGRRTFCVVEGDQETLFDADRIKATGAPVVQINTGAGCHLDADMLHRGMDALDPPEGSLLFVENVGNLVCPALFDLGESAKVVIVSVTEGDDKPLKYPHMFAAADLIVVNKTDLLPYVDFDLQRCEHDARSLNPGVTVLPLSVRSGDGMSAWYSWLDAV